MIENDYENETINDDQILYPQIQELDHFSFDDKAQIISTIIVPFLFKNLNLEKQLCSLYKMDGYFISCISIEKIIKEKRELSNQNHEIQQQFFSESFRLSILTEKDEDCEQLFQINQLDLLIICNSLNRLNIYSINLNNITITNKDFDFDKTQYKFCQVKYEQYFDNSFLLIFYDCVQWAIYIQKDTFLNLIFNSDIALENDSYFDIDFVENIQICQEKIIISGNYKYFQYSYKSNNTLSINFFGSKKFFKQVLFDRFCIIQYYLLESQSNNKIYITNENTNFELEGIPKYVYFVSNVLFIINEEGLLIILNKKFRKKVELKIFPLHFYYINNFFYQIDYESKTFKFYKYKIINNYIINPTKKFLLYFSYYRQFIDESPSQCQLIQMNKNSTQIQTYNYSLQINIKCEIIDKIFIKKPSVQLPENFKVVIESDILNLVKNIDDKEKFESLCQIPKQHLQNIHLLYYLSDHKACVIFLTAKFLNILYCDDQKLVQIYIQNQKVINFKQQILLLNDYVDHLKIVQIFNGLPKYQEYKLDSNIQEFVQNSKYVLIITKSLQKVELFDLNFIQTVQLPSLLNQILLNIYLNNLNKEENLQNFYCKKGKNIFILQYYKHLMVFKQDQIFHFELKQQILSIIQISSFLNAFHIVAVDKNENCFVQFVLDQADLTLWNKHCLQNSQFIYPIIYQEFQNQIIIAITKDNCTFLNIFTFQETNIIKLKQTIKVSQKQFFINQNQLFYFDINNQISILNLDHLIIELNPILQYNRNFKIDEKLVFYIKNEFIDNTQIIFASNISFFFQCQKLIPLKNEFSIILDNNTIIQLNDLFQGAIDILKLEGNSNVLLEGPFLYQQQNNQNNNELLTVIYNVEQYNVQICLITIQSISDYMQILKIQIKNQEEDLFQEKYGIFLYAFYLNQSQIIFFFEIENQVKAQIFRINQEKLTITDDSDQLIINNYNQNLEITKQNNLFQIKQGQHYDYLYIENGNMLLLQNIKGIKNLLLIQNSNELLLESKFQYSQSLFSISLIKIEQLDFLIIKQFTLSLDTLLEDFDKRNKDQYTYKNISVINASISTQTLKIKVLIILENYSTLQNIQIDLTTGEFNFTNQKIVRNPLRDFSNLKFIDVNYLILNEGHSCYIYDIRPIKEIYDYIFFYQFCYNTIYQYNTTHYIFYELDFDIFMIGQIDYRIRILNNQTQTENCTLIAENSLSKAEITLHLIQNISQKSPERTFAFSILCLTVICIVLIIYFIRRSFLKKRKQFSILNS
ncbi:unnamed protein product [Paramecium sonneborni]|uniref:Transmembrane protein n=1 Tax=Paramecium sonneborni TaxID=65129 RepID=A0A8S1RDP5_9CILI|nr:unnamed protein product [Paramecium sonneborni]